MADQEEQEAHWDAAYAQGDDTRSWFEEYPGMSLRMLGAAGVRAADALIDVGGGASPLTGALLDRGFGDLTEGGAKWGLIRQGPGRAHHPAGAIQPFTCVALRRQS